MSKYKQAPDFTVIKDTREQEGYFFSKFNTCAGMIEHKLDTGDYSKTFEVTKEFSRYETEGTGPFLPDNLRYMVDGWIDRYVSEYP